MSLVFRLFLAFLSLVFTANAKFYVGAGLSASNNSYTISQDSISGSNVKKNGSMLQKAFNSSKAAIANISAMSNYEKTQLVALTSSFTTNTVNLSPIQLSINIQDNTATNYCMNGAVIIGIADGGNAGNECSYGAETSATTGLIAQDIGNAFLNQYQTLLQEKGKKLEFNNMSETIKFTQYFGEQILMQINGGTAPADIPAIISALQGSSIFNAQDTATVTINLIASGNILITQSQLQPIAQAFLATLNTLDPTIVADAFTSPVEEANSVGVEALLSVGYMANYRGFYYGGEGLFEYGFNQIGNNSNSEVSVKYDLTGSLIAKVGYGFSERSFAYANVGAALRQYKASWNGSSEYSYIPHLLLGVGLEFHAYKNINIFTEINYLVGLKKFDLADVIDNGVKMKLSSQKLSVGVRYYLNGNSITIPQRSQAIQSGSYKATANGIR